MITKPTLLIDKGRCVANIKTMVSRAKRNNCVFRPHFKTHQSLEVGQWFKEIGVSKITVSSLEMADYFSSEWHDITVAFPVNILEINTINKLAEKISLNLLLESVESAKFLTEKLEYPARFFIKIDVGAERTGLNEDQTEEINAILSQTAETEQLEFRGFLTHAGQTYQCRAVEEIEAIHNRSIDILNDLKKRYLTAYPDLILSTGDTPSCSLMEDFSGVDEIRPGNFVYFDLTQCQIGSCSADQIAIALACPVVAKHKDRNELVVYGGGIHFSKEFMIDDKLGKMYGMVVHKTESSWGEIVPDTYLSSLSQEHGIVNVPGEYFEEYRIGDLIYFLPVHSCMMVNLMKHRQPIILDR